MEAATSSQIGPPPPKHVAIIMDGNGRWAHSRGLPRMAGHQRGADSVRTSVRCCLELGISHLTLYAFSSENWKRPSSEVDDLMSLMRLYLRRELEELHRRQVRVRFIGARVRLPNDIVALIDEAEAKTRENGELTLVVALDYGSHDEIVRACRAMAAEVAAGQLAIADITEERFERYLETADLPHPDLVIRTSGEQRLSNFLLWQSAYAELVFTDTLWPDFSKQTLEDAISEFRHRERRYGGRSG